MWPQNTELLKVSWFAFQLFLQGIWARSKILSSKFFWQKWLEKLSKCKNEPGEHALQYFTTHMYLHLIFMCLNLTENKFLLNCRLHFPLWYLGEFYALKCAADVQSREELLGISQGSYFLDILYDYCKAKIWLWLQLWNRMQGNEEPSKIFPSREELEVGSNKGSFITSISDLWMLNSCKKPQTKQIKPERYWLLVMPSYFEKVWNWFSTYFYIDFFFAHQDRITTIVFTTIKKKRRKKKILNSCICWQGQNVYCHCVL